MTVSISMRNAVRIILHNLGFCTGDCCGTTPAVRTIKRVGEESKHALAAQGSKHLMQAREGRGITEGVGAAGG